MHVYEKALKFSLFYHNNQVRKGSDMPYVVHPTEVANLLLTAKASPNLIVAGFLHDLLEDTNCTLNTIHTEFGKEVATLVSKVTNAKCYGMTPAEKKEFTYSHYVQETSTIVFTLKAADLICNVRDIHNGWLADGDKVFNRFTTDKNETVEHYKKMCMLAQKKIENRCLKHHLNLALSSLREMSA